MSDTYIPFGPEWEAEVMKMGKVAIIGMLRRASVKNQIMGEPMALPVKAVNGGHFTAAARGNDWQCDVTFGTPSDDHDDPTITVHSHHVERYPVPGDVMMVYPPRVVGYQEKEGA